MTTWLNFGAMIHRSIYSSVSTTAQPLIADPETEPYKYQIQRLAIYNLSPGTNATIDEKINGKYSSRYCAGSL